MSKAWSKVYLWLYAALAVVCAFACILQTLLGHIEAASDKLVISALAFTLMNGAKTK